MVWCFEAGRPSWVRERDMCSMQDLLSALCKVLWRNFTVSRVGGSMKWFFE